MTLSRGPAIVDILFSADECVVLTEQRCLRLSVAATAVLRSLSAPSDRAAVRVHVESVCGPAPDGAFESVVSELVGSGLVAETDMVPLTDS